MKELYIIDRIEGDYIVIESPSGEMVNAEKNKIIGNFREGDCLILKNNYFIIDKEATEARQKEVENLMKGIWDE